MTRWTRRQALGHLGRLALGTAAGWSVVSRPAAGAGALRKVGIILGGPQINEGFVTIAVAQYLGFYRDEGIEVELIPSGGSNQAVQEVAAGKVLVGFPSPDPVILGYQPEAGLRLLWIYTAYQGFIYDIRTPAGSPLRSLAELGGKTIGVVNLASAAVPAARAMLHENGVDPRSVTFVGIGVGSQAAAAVRAGRVDAVALWDTIYAELENEGIRFNPPFVSPTLRKLFSNGLAVLPTTFQAERALLVGLCRAMAKGTVWTFANPAQAVRIFWRVYPASKPAGFSEDEALRRSLHVLRARLANMTLDWVPVKRWGWNDPTRWTAYEKFLYDQGIEKTRVDITRIFTNALIPEINHFDAAALAEQAKTYVVGR
jgi:NitT/TauT family transport system substrate-binding protein